MLRLMGEVAGGNWIAVYVELPDSRVIRGHVTGHFGLGGEA
jgi:hypothetical protein